MGDLPQELVDSSEIPTHHTEELHTDWKNHFHEGFGAEYAPVAKCGLISKLWLPRSRSHLFSTVRLSNDYEFGTDNIKQFLRLVAGSPPTIPLLLSYIQFLDLDLLAGPLRDEEMRRVLLRLPMLSGLRLRTPADDSAPLADAFYDSLRPHIPLLAVNSPFLSSFHLALNADVPLPFLIHLLSSLPSLESMTVGTPRNEAFDIVDADSTVVFPGYSFPQNLSTLDLHLSCGTGLFFTWILSILPELPLLRSLRLSLYPRDSDYPISASLIPIGEYLRRAGSTLESLSLSLSRACIDESDFPSTEQSDLEYQWLGLASGLSDLTFTPSNGALEIPNILSTLPSSRLSELTIALSEVEELPWAEMDLELSRPKFHTLQRFAVEDAQADSKDNLSLFSEAVKKTMPLSKARGILFSRFDYVNSEQ
ncbi:hypothetical protein R3P38DRAFT_3039429 [Favolaschia claudopus]|uniref:Uncharacterized protein n=1 Tax=Favolaschia claudopus TaxID=2862362 RepID=A0AAW0A9D3_9AGAR